MQSGKAEYEEKQQQNGIPWYWGDVSIDKVWIVKKAIDYFIALFLEEDKATIKVCCRLIQFGMSSTLLIFKDQYFEYNGEKSIDKKV